MKHGRTTTVGRRKRRRLACEWERNMRRAISTYGPLVPPRQPWHRTWDQEIARRRAERPRFSDIVSDIEKALRK